MNELENPVKPFQQSGRLKKLYWWLLGIIFFTELILLRLAFADYAEQGLARCLWAFLISSGLPLSILFRLQVNVRPVVFAKYSLLPERLEVRSGSKLMNLKFSDLRSVKFSTGWSRFFRGYTLRHESGQAVRVFSTLENSETILKNIQTLRPELVRDKDFTKYLKLMKLNEISWARLYELKKRYKAYSLNFLGLPLLFTLATWWSVRPAELLAFDFQLMDWFLFVLLVHGVFALFLNMIEEKVLYLTYSNKILDPGFQRSPQKEDILKILFLSVYWAVSIGLAVYLHTLV